MKILILLSLLLSFTASGQKKTKSADPLNGLDTALQRVLKDRLAAGFAVAVVKNDQVIYEKGFGYRDYEKKLPVTPITLFAIGSSTKAFTASLLGLLQGENRLDFDKPVRNYLPELEFFNNQLNNDVTVRDVIVHRTGLPRHDFSWYLFNSGSRDSLMRRIKYLEPTYPLRQAWQYNNFMYLVQGMIAEKMFGKSWEALVKEKILDPLGMTTSNFSIHDLKKNTDAAFGNLVHKDSIIRKMDYYDINAMGPAGSINSNVHEMANWVITWINGGKYRGKEILPVPYIREAMSSQMIMGPGLPDKEIPDAHFSTYGFGWMLSSYRGHYRVEHGGNIDGFSASVSFFPADSIGIIVLANQNGSAVPGIVRNIIADRLLGEKPIDWNGRANDAQAKAKANAMAATNSSPSGKKTGTAPSHSLQDYEGLYKHPGYGVFEIEDRNDSLILISQTGEAWLRHYHYDVFEVLQIDRTDGIDTAGTGQLKIQFEMTTAGDISGATLPLQPGLKDILFNKSSKPKKVAAGDLKKYEGTYSFGPGMEAKFYIKGTILFAFVEGQPEYELTPTGKNKFDLPLSGYRVVFEEENGMITAVTFIQPNGSFKAPKNK